MTPAFDRDAFFAACQLTTDSSDLADDQRWSTWPETAHTLDRGPQPFPDWVVQHDGAVATELGVLKTGKEAEAFLLERSLPAERLTGAPGERTLLVAKRYRSAERVSFHRSSVYAEGRRTRDSREARAMAKGTAFGREAAAARWARTEFDALGRLWSAGLPVPDPVQIQGTELCMEFIGADGATPHAAPRLHEARPGPALAACWAEELHEIVLGLARQGLAHGDLSPYNILVDPRGRTERLVVIDVPQVVDLVANVHGAELLRRDCETVCAWLRAHGTPPALAEAAGWYTDAVTSI